MDVIVQKIKPLLDDISKDPTVENIVLLSVELEKVEGNLLQHFQSVVLLNIINVIRISKIRLEQKTHLIKCMNIVIRKTKLQRPVQFETLLKCMIHEVYNESTRTLRSDLSEEMKIEIADCIANSSQKLDLDVIEKFYVKDQVVLLAQGFFVCVEIIMKEKYRKLKFAAIRCIQSLMQVHDGVEYDLVLRHQIAEVLFVILPKTLGALVSVIHGDEKQGQLLIAESLKAFGRVVCLVMQDYSQQPEDHLISVSDFRAIFDTHSTNSLKDADILGTTAKSEEKKREFFNSVERTEEWLQAASRKMAPTIKSLAKIRGSQSPVIRKELAVLSSLLVELCSNNLRYSLPDLLENLIALSHDPNKDTSLVCKRALKQFIDTQKYLDVWSELETLLYNHLLTIPRIMNQCEESAQIAALSLLHGYLTFLSNETLRVIVNQQHILENLIKALIACAELELPAGLLESGYAIPGIDQMNRLLGKQSWKTYKHLKSDLVESAFRVVCQAIGQSVIFERVVSYILDNMLENVVVCNEFLAILGEICAGIDGSRSSAEQKRNTEAILDELSSDLHWNLETRPNKQIGIAQDEFGETKWLEDKIEGVYESATEIRVKDIRYNDVDDDDSDLITIVDAKFNVLHECLALEMLGNGALALGPDFERYLFKFLHRILEKAGNNNTHIHNAGHFALSAAAKALKFTSTAELIHHNSNFFIYFINKYMKSRQYNSSGLDILSVVLKYSSLDSIPYLENMVKSVLEELSLHQRKDVTASLNIFNVFITNVSGWQVVDQTTPNTVPPTTEQTSTLEKWLAILNRNNDMPCVDPTPEVGKSAQELFEEDMSNQPTSDEEMDTNNYPSDPEKPPLPKHVELTLNILTCCLKYIPSSIASEQAIAVETVTHGLTILSDYENELLPLVHQVWYPLTERFKEKNPIVASRCFDLLLTLGRCAKDFILQRTFKDVAPHLNKFLNDSAVDSSKKSKDTAYLYSQQCKLQHKVLTNYAVLLVNLDVRERDLDNILEIVIKYMNANQPLRLQEAAKTFTNTMYEFDPTAVSLKLMSVT